MLGSGCPGCPHAVGACCPHHSCLYGLGGGWCALSEVAVAELEVCPRLGAGAGEGADWQAELWGWGWQQGGGGHGFTPRALTASVLVAR